MREHCVSDVSAHGWHARKSGFVSAFSPLSQREQIGFLMASPRSVNVTLPSYCWGLMRHQAYLHGFGQGVKGGGGRGVAGFV